MTRGNHWVHGYTGTRTHAIWCGMKARCKNPNVKCFKNYGGRGISYCPEWENFEVFLKDMGEAPAGLSLDRIDVNKGYSPDNCKWSTNSEQARNRRVSNNTGEKHIYAREMLEGNITYRIIVPGMKRETRYTLTEAIMRRNELLELN